jgi:excisionase family DNA binding protein
VEGALFPPDELHQGERDRLRDVLAALDRPRAGDRTGLVAPDGKLVELPEEIRNLLWHVVRDLANGQAVMVQATDPMLTTGQAAEILGVTRVTLVKLLESGEIPFHRVGNHRRVKLVDVTAYVEAVQSRREAAINAVVYESAHDGTADASNRIPLAED